MSEQPTILAPNGKAVTKSKNCPHCGSGPQMRRAYETLAGTLVACLKCGNELPKGDE